MSCCRFCDMNWARSRTVRNCAPECTTSASNRTRTVHTRAVNIIWSCRTHPSPGRHAPWAGRWTAYRVCCTPSTRRMGAPGRPSCTSCAKTNSAMAVRPLRAGRWPTPPWRAWSFALPTLARSPCRLTPPGAGHSGTKRWTMGCTGWKPVNASQVLPCG